jgi:hypothetical protein
MICSRNISKKQVVSTVQCREAVALGKSSLFDNEQVKELVNWMNIGDFSGASAAQLKWIKRYKRYYKKKGGLTKKQIVEIVKTKKILAMESERATGLIKAK